MIARSKRMSAKPEVRIAKGRESLEVWGFLRKNRKRNAVIMMAVLRVIFRLKRSNHWKTAVR
jgi:hypothetical protein